MTDKSLRGRLKRHLEDYLSEFVYGGMDGAVTTFAVVAGATGARFDAKVILVLGFANLIADGFSMSVGAYLSTKSEHEIRHKRGDTDHDEPSAVINGFATFLSFLAVGFVPLIIYTFDLIFGFQITHPFLITSIMTAVAFILVGMLKSRVARTPMLRAVLETLILGVLAASFAYLLGDFLERLIT